jgi:hypothetical protein
MADKDKTVDKKTVHIFPAEGAYIPGVPAIEQDVDAETAKELLAYSPPAFTLKPPAEGPAEEPAQPEEGTN